jgi:glutathione S-transferase
MKIKIYGDSTADHLGLAYDWIETSVVAEETRTADFLAINPAGQVPAVILADGRPLAQSNAIILHLAEGSDLIPTDTYLRARMFEWLFWEQYSHEPYIAVARFHVRFLGKPVAELDPRLFEGGHTALRRLDESTQGGGFLVGDGVSLADIALVAYTRWAGEGGFDLTGYPALRAWIGRVERALGIVD